LTSHFKRLIKGARGLVQIFTELDTYRRWGVAPRPENLAAKGSEHQYKKKTDDFEAL